MVCSSLMWISEMLWVSLGDLWGLWNLKGISGVRQRTLGLLVDTLDATNREDLIWLCKSTALVELWSFILAK